MERDMNWFTDLFKVSSKKDNVDKSADIKELSGKELTKEIEAVTRSIKRAEKKLTRVREKIKKTESNIGTNKNKKKEAPLEIELSPHNKKEQYAILNLEKLLEELESDLEELQQERQKRDKDNKSRFEKLEKVVNSTTEKMNKKLDSQFKEFEKNVNKVERRVSEQHDELDKKLDSTIGKLDKKENVVKKEVTRDKLKGFEESSLKTDNVVQKDTVVKHKPKVYNLSSKYNQQLDEIEDKIEKIIEKIHQKEEELDKIKSTTKTNNNTLEDLDDLIALKKHSIDEINDKQKKLERFYDKTWNGPDTIKTGQVTKARMLEKINEKIAAVRAEHKEAQNGLKILESEKNVKAEIEQLEGQYSELREQSKVVGKGGDKQFYEELSEITKSLSNSNIVASSELNERIANTENIKQVNSDKMNGILEQGNNKSGARTHVDQIRDQKTNPRYHGPERGG